MTRWTEADMPDLSGRRMIVTGGNSGIGLETVRALCRHGAEVVLAARDPGRGEAALRTLAAEGLKPRFAALDLSSLASIRRFAAGIESVDVLINNAGVMGMPRRMLTEDGFERQFGTNHLGHFALTGLLLPTLLRGTDPRVVTVASIAHRRARIDFDNLQGERRYVPMAAYAVTKLANLLFAQELRRRAAGRLDSIAVHPGVSFTSIVTNGMGQGGDWKAPLMQLAFRLIGQSAARGALPSLMAASGAAPKDAVYIGPDGIREMAGYPAPAAMTAQARDLGAARRLWEVSEQLTGVHYAL
jgi:NAD(P)-dependent dehydrogenase (short-subunit alcohol dehydrogenase family)